MSDKNLTFITTEYASRIEKNKEELLDVLRNNRKTEVAEQIEAKLDKISSQEKIKVVFIGQYTAGKSTIISALSGDNDIKIDSNISTEYAKDYNWGSVILTDTPGLYTENKEHDQRTIEAIKESDLLIYCITSDLFNQYTIEDFKKWAYEYNYAGKMFLVINKMSKEAGDYDDLCKNYASTINKDLSPNRINDFSYAFFDAKDYKDGIKDGDRELIEYSHFEEFIEKLNDFIKTKGELGKFDTPINVLKAAIDSAIEDLSEDESSREYSALLSRIERAIDEIRKRVDVESRKAIKKYLRPIIDKGSELSRKIGIEEIQFSEEQIQELVEKCCDELNRQLTDLCDRGQEELNKQIEGILQSDIATYFFDTIKEINDKTGIFERNSTKAKRLEFESINKIVETVTQKTIELATKNGTQTAGFFLRSSEAAGSQLHQVVYNVGKQFGHNFKPYEAVHIAKNIGNVAKVLGPVVMGIGVILDIKTTVQENSENKKYELAKVECRNSFIDIEKDIENQYIDELSNLFKGYESVTRQVQEDRENIQKMFKKDKDLISKLLDIRRDLTDIQGCIF